MIDDCARLRNRVHKILDRDGIGGVLSDVFGVKRILHGVLDGEPRDLLYRSLNSTFGIIDGESREKIVASLSRHVANKRDTRSPRLRPVRSADPGRPAATTMRARRSRATTNSFGKASTASRSSFSSCRRSPGSTRSRPPPWPRHRRVRFRCSLRRLVRRLSRQRQKRRQTTQRAKPQRHAAQGAGVRTAPHEPTTVNSKATIRRFGYAAERAIVATAHKLLRVVYCVLRTGKPYRDPETDYQAVKRNAPRWMLEMYNIAG